MVEAARARTCFAREIGPMASLAGAIDVLTECPLVALDHVPAPARHRAPGTHGERQDARGRRQRW